MHPGWNVLTATLAAAEMPVWLANSYGVIMVIIGFSLIIFVHELGHFLAAKWVGIRVDRFAIGFGYRLFGWRQGEGFTFGSRPNYTADQLEEKKYGGDRLLLQGVAAGRLREDAGAGRHSGQR